VNLVGFIIRIYHDARSHERQLPRLNLMRLSQLNFTHILIDCDKPWGFTAREVTRENILKLEG